MKSLPTLGVVLTAAARAARRFPLVLLAAGLAAGAGILLVNSSGEDEPYTRLLVTATLGLPLFVALTLTGERRFAAGDAARRWALQVLGVIVLVLFWVMWPRWPEPVQIARYVELSVSFHLLAAFLPYAGVDEPNGFWQYNRALFTRVLIAVLFAGVLYAGLAVALAALDKLLGVDVAHEAYMRLWMIIAFLFTTWFFAGGIPADFAALEQRRDVPTGLRVLSQYVLVPIVVIYLAILTLYLGKVLIERQWPSGWIGYLVSSVASVGILAWLLVRPLEDSGQRWVRTYTRSFYAALLPAIVMLWLAIGKRVAQYGITERRYFLIVLSLWWAGIAIYYTVSRSRDIKIVPATLCLLGLVTFMGPLGAYQVSLASQRGRLDRLVARYALRPAPAGVRAGEMRDVPFTDRKEIAATLRYLLQRGDGRAIAARFGGPAVPAAADVEPRVRKLMTSLGVEYVSPWETEESVENLSFSSRWDRTPLRIDGYTLVLHLAPDVGDSVPIETDTVLFFVKGPNVFRVMANGRTLLEMPLQPVIDRVAAYRRQRDDYEIPMSLLRAEATGEQAAGELYLTSMYATRQGGAWSVSSYSGELFLRLR